MTNGENIIYHYIQKTLLKDGANDEFTKELIERLIVDLSIWLPIDLYKQVPILLPYVIRDPSCRNRDPNLDEYGQSNEKGFLRDDNSLIKGIIKSFIVKGKRVKEYDGKKLSNGFVACHIWRKLRTVDILASKFEKTNSFVPNLVWLPKQIAKLTDREGSFAQNLLKNISYKLYFEADAQREFINPIWNELENPNTQMKFDLNVETLNHFIVPQIWIDKKKKGLLEEFSIIKNTVTTKTVTGKVKSSAYLTTFLQKSSSEEQELLLSWLDQNAQEMKNGR